jgi:hypothetical protein
VKQEKNESQEKLHEHKLKERQAQAEKEELEFEQEIKKKKREYEEELSQTEQEIKLHRQKLEKQKLEMEIANKSASTLFAQEEREVNSNLLKIAEDKAKREEAELSFNAQRERLKSWLKLFTIAIVLLIFLLAATLGLYRLYRWAVEEPLIKEVEKMVEVEKIVEKEVEKIIEKEVDNTPEVCSQIRRNGKIFMNCDGVTIDGSPTLGDSGLKNVPELITNEAEAISKH